MRHWWLVLALVGSVPPLAGACGSDGSGSGVAPDGGTGAAGGAGGSVQSGGSGGQSCGSNASCTGNTDCFPISCVCPGGAHLSFPPQCQTGCCAELQTTCDAACADAGAAGAGGAGGQADAAPCPNTNPGLPKPTLLAAVEDGGDSIGLSASYVYFAGLQDLERVPIAGGGAEVLVVPAHPNGLALDATSVYWTDWVSASISQLPLAGGTPSVLVTSGTQPKELAVDATNAYWEDLVDHVVMKVPLSGGTPTTLASSVSPLGLVVDSTDVYFGDAQTKSVMKVAIAGGTPVTLASPVEDGYARTPIGLVLDGGELFVSLEQWGLVTMPQGGGTPVALAQATTIGTHLAVDATHVYWTTTGTCSKVQRVPRAGGTIEDLADGRDSARDLTLDADHVYWQDKHGVYSLPK